MLISIISLVILIYIYLLVRVNFIDIVENEKISSISHTILQSSTVLFNVVYRYYEVLYLLFQFVI